jgi:LAO/AO transport system kinase
VGITGVPGVGKSTFIDRLGTYLANEQGRNVAVLAIDPSSERSQGSILGDKSRMPGLAISERAFVRPSPTRGYLSGVTRWTQETILVCEAAGYDTILVETVGVGQSEIAIKDMVDTYLLLLLPGAGDELQGMKRGVVEMADILAVTKSDGPNLLAAEVAQTAYRNATHLLPRQPSGWIPEVLRCSAVADDGIAEIWNSVLRHRATLLKGEWFLSQRQGQRVKWFEQEVALQALERLHNQLGENSSHQELVAQVEQGKIPASIAARILVDLLQQAP